MNHPDESKTRTHRFSELPGDVDLWAPNKLLDSEANEKQVLTPMDQAIDKKLWPKQSNKKSFMSGPS